MTETVGFWANLFKKLPTWRGFLDYLHVAANWKDIEKERESRSRFAWSADPHTLEYAALWRAAIIPRSWWRPRAKDELHGLTLSEAIARSVDLKLARSEATVSSTAADTEAA